MADFQTSKCKTKFKLNVLTHRTSVYTVKKKVREFPVSGWDVTTKLSLGGKNDVITELFLPRGSLVSDIPAGYGKFVNLFLRCMYVPQGAAGAGGPHLEPPREGS